jgi:hypothetical protein
VGHTNRCCRGPENTISHRGLFSTLLHGRGYGGKVVPADVGITDTNKLQHLTIHFPGKRTIVDVVPPQSVGKQAAQPLKINRLPRQ